MRVDRRVLFALLAAAAFVPAAAPGETVRLRDSSTLRGRLVRVEGDSLTFRLAVGATVRLHRSQVLAVIFDDSLAAVPMPGAGTEAARPSGTGRVELSFKDRELSSKISIELKKDWEGHVAANVIVVEFLVDGRVAYTASDTTTDKKIYKGRVTQLKNETEMKDFAIDVPAGTRHCKLIVRNLGADEYRDDFDPAPLNLVLPFDNVEVVPGQVSRLDVGITRGKLRMSQPRLVRIE